MSVLTEPKPPALNTRAHNFLEHLLANGYILVEHVSDWACFAWETIHGEQHPEGKLSPGSILYTGRNEEEFTSETLAVQAEIQQGDRKAFGYSFVNFVPHKTVNPNETYWVSKGVTVKKHVVRNRNTNQFFLCFNGIPVFHVNLGYQETYTEPKYAIRRAGFLEDNENVLLGKEKGESFFFNFTMSLSVTNFMLLVTDDDKIVDYCLGLPVMFDENWVAWNSLHIVSTWDYATTPALKKLTQWAEDNNGTNEVLRRAASNPTLPDSYLKYLIDSNTTFFSPTWTCQLVESKQFHKMSIMVFS